MQTFFLHFHSLFTFKFIYQSSMNTFVTYDYQFIIQTIIHFIFYFFKKYVYVSFSEVFHLFETTSTRHRHESIAIQIIHMKLGIKQIKCVNSGETKHNLNDIKIDLSAAQISFRNEMQQ